MPSTAQPGKWSGVLPDKYIAVLTEMVSRQNIEGWVRDLSAYHTRHTKSVYCDQVANWLEARFVGLGYSQVSLHGYTRDGFQRHNVVCTKAGVGGTGE